MSLKERCLRASKPAVDGQLISPALKTPKRHKRPIALSYPGPRLYRTIAPDMPEDAGVIGSQTEGEDLDA